MRRGEGRGGEEREEERMGSGKVMENEVLEYEGQHKFQPRSNGCSLTCKCNSSQLFTTHMTRPHEMDFSHTHGQSRYCSP